MVGKAINIFKVNGKGLGGRNQELVLSFAMQASHLLINER